MDALGRQVSGRNYPPTNKNTLIRALTEEWDKWPQQLLDNVVQSMISSGVERNFAVGKIRPTLALLTPVSSVYCVFDFWGDRMNESNIATQDNSLLKCMAGLIVPYTNLLLFHQFQTYHEDEQCLSVVC
ncbi:hypothetical protein TNCV_3541621 [Trichonephila clavipes]|nr:hypothetical protein TNCV_3541621 [Trichonephila clavipes]